MSFDLKTSSLELQKALDYANQKGVICAASAGNDGVAEIVYPAALQTDVMGVASTTDQDRRSSFSNFGTIVWVAAPGEAIVTNLSVQHLCGGMGNLVQRAAGFRRGGVCCTTLMPPLTSPVALRRWRMRPACGPRMGNGRLDLCSTSRVSGQRQVVRPGLQRFCRYHQRDDYGGTAGQSSPPPLHRCMVSTQTVMWSCTGAPPQATCAVSPSSVTMDGKIAATATVTLSTTARVFSPLLALPRYAPPMRGWETWEALFAWLAILVLLIICSSSRASRQRPGLAATAVSSRRLALHVLLWRLWPAAAGSSTLSSVALNPPVSMAGLPRPAR